MSVIELIFETLLENVHLHAPGTKIYSLIRTIARQEVERRFSAAEPLPSEFGRELFVAETFGGELFL